LNRNPQRARLLVDKYDAIKYLKSVHAEGRVIDDQQNFESLEDSCVDLINYASFFASYMAGKMDGQKPDRDFLNRPMEITNETSN